MRTSQSKFPLWKTLLATAFAGLIILGFWAFFFGVGPMDIGPASRELQASADAYRKAGWPWEAKDVAPRAANPEENAAPLLTEALSYFDDKQFNEDFKDFYVQTADGSLSQYDERLVPYKHGLDLALQASERPKLDFARDWDQGPNVLFPEYGGVKSLVKALCLRAQVECSEGKVAAACKDLAGATKISRLLRQEPTLIGMLVDIAGEAISMRAYQMCASQLKGNAKGLEALQASLGSSNLPNFGFALRGEAYMNLALLRNLDKYGGAKAFLQSATVSGESQTIPKVDPRQLRRTGLPTGMFNRAYLNHNFKYWISVAPLLAQYPHDPAKLGPAIEAKVTEMTTHQSASGLLDNLLMPIYTQAGLAIVRLDANIEVTKGLIKAMTIEAQTGSFPTQLPGSFIDPYNKQPLHVIASDGGISVYSVGPNLKDDGGIDKRELKDGSNEDYDIVASYPPIKARKVKASA